MDRWSSDYLSYAVRVALNMLDVLNERNGEFLPDTDTRRMIGSDGKPHKIAVVDAHCDGRETVSIGLEIDGRPVTLKLEAD